MKYEGIVNKKTEKFFPANGKMREATLYGLALRNVDGFFGLGKAPVTSFNEGDYIEFEANEKRAVDVNSIRVTKPTAPTTATVSGVSAAKQAFGKEDNRQKSIVLQSSRKDAIELLKVMVSAGAIELPKTKDKAQTAILAYVEEYTDRFFLDTMNVDERSTERVEEEVTELGDVDPSDAFGDSK